MSEIPETPESPKPDSSGEPLDPASNGLPSKPAAAIACIFPLIGGIVMLLLKRKDRFVRFYALQSIFFAVVWVIAKVAVEVSVRLFNLLPVIGGIMGAILHIAWIMLALLFFVIYVIQIIKAASGVEWEIPYVGPFAREQMK